MVSVWFGLLFVQNARQLIKPRLWQDFELPPLPPISATNRRTTPERSAPVKGGRSTSSSVVVVLVVVLVVVVVVRTCA